MLPGVANMAAVLPINLAKLQAIVINATQQVTLGFNAINAAQTVTVGGGPTGGTFTISGALPLGLDDGRHRLERDGRPGRLGRPGGDLRPGRRDGHGCGRDRFRRADARRRSC